jgi:hypothetical protein
MLELFAIETGTNITIGIVTRIVALLKRLGGYSDDIDVATPQTLSQEPMGGSQDVPA